MHLSLENPHHKIRTPRFQWQELTSDQNVVFHVYHIYHWNTRHHLEVKEVVEETDGHIILDRYACISRLWERPKRKFAWWQDPDTRQQPDTNINRQSFQRDLLYTVVGAK